MRKNILNTPEGTRDLLFEETLALRAIENELEALFAARGYSEVVTPTIEFYDVFNSSSRYFSQESLYKLTDGKGRLIVIRPDSTMPIARLSATRLKEEEIPLKLFYCQNIFRVNPKDSGRDDEIFQSGIEIIGGETRRCDFEALSLALLALEKLSADFRLEIGDSAFFKLLAGKLGCIPGYNDEDGVEKIRLLTETKNYPELREFLSSLPDSGNNPRVRALALLPKLFGGEETFAEAEKIFAAVGDAELLTALGELQGVYAELMKLGGRKKISVDFGMVNKADYYTGIIFRGYISGAGKSVLSGGRYDNLLSDFGAPHPAVGFAVNLSPSALNPVKHKSPDVLVWSADGEEARAALYSRELVKEGLTAETALFKTAAEARRYGAGKNIPKLVILGENGITEEILC